MGVPPLLIYDLVFFFTGLLITISSIYSAWMNLGKRRISKFGFDVFILLFFNRRMSKIIRKDPRAIKRMGILSLLVALGGVDSSISFFIERIYPYFK